jgi:hypothetical protein
VGHIAIRQWAAAEQRRRERKVRRSGEDATQRHAEWSRVQFGLTRFVEETRSFRGLAAGSSRDTVAALRRNERAFLAVADAHLIEPRPSGGRVVGGLFVPGFDQATSVDVGALVVTDRRAVLRSGAQDREWLFRNLSGVHHDPDAPWTALEVSDRQEVSGFLYGHADVPLVRFRLMLAIAVHTGTVGRLRAELESELSRHAGRRPPSP